MHNVVHLIFLQATGFTQATLLCLINSVM